MNRIVVTGPTKLRGTVRISGAKNAALPLLASSLLTTGTCTWKNVPHLQDVEMLLALLQTMGASTSLADHVAHIDTQSLHTQEASYDLVKAMRASILVLGPLVARYGTAKVALPGGCAIGARPVDQHLKGLEALGATIQLEHGYIMAQAKRLQGATIVLDMPTVTGTENLMMAAALAQGTTILENVAREPEIEALAQAINAMGGKITGAGNSVMYIEGVDTLHPIEFTVMPDRIEAGTFLVAATMCQGDVVVKNCDPNHLDAVTSKLKQAGAILQTTPTSIHIQGPETISAFDIITQPYPGFPTDLQAQFLSLACLAKGQSTLTETIFENRYMHVPELIRMGANISIHGQTAMVRGVAGLSGAEVLGTDLRASASLILAGLCAQGDTSVGNIYHLDRGYEQMETKLQKLGATVKRVS